MKSSFKPSDVRLDRSFPPLVGVFGRSEMECAAALIVHALAVNGDEWKPVTEVDLKKVISDAAADGKGILYAMLSNPFLRPGIGDGISELAKGGFIDVDEGGRSSFNDAGIERLRKYSAARNVR